MNALILTAGNGSRIRSVSSCRSKCMLPVKGRPILAWLLDACAESGEIETIHIVVHREEKEIQKYFGDEYRKIPLQYHVQADLSSGLVGAIYAPEDLALFEGEVLLILGDEFFGKLDAAALIQAFRRRPDAVLAVTVPTENSEEIRKNYSVLLSPDGRILNAIEKPQDLFNNQTGTGVVLFPAGLLADFARNFFPLQGKNLQLVDLLLFAKEAYAFPLDTFFCNLNGPLEYAQLTANPVPPLPFSRLADAFRKTAAACFERTAVICGTETISFGELDRLSDRFCRNLLAAGCRPGCCVALLCSRTITHLAAMLGVLKAGCCYLPLDEHLPAARLEYMAAKAHAVCVIALPDIMPEGIRFDCPVLSSCDLLGEGIPGQPLAEGPEPEDSMREAAYILFTSGSTGTPKGVMISQESVLNLAARIQAETLELLHEKVLKIGVTASFAFDLSVQQIYPALLGGHTLHIVPYEAKLRPSSLAAALDTLDVCDGTPLMLHLLNQFLAANPDKAPRLKLFFSAGEELKKEIIHTFFSFCPDCLVINCYGPTECTVETVLFPMTRQIENDCPVIPLGTPIGGTRIYVLDEEQHLICPGDTGEIWIAGAGVGLGYIHEEELTAKAFQPDLLIPGQTMYRTGDRGYWGKDGKLYYAGRIDHQVKFKGYRMELGEIEHALESLEGIAICKVLLTGTPPDHQQLTAYYTLQPGSRILPEKLPTLLAKTLPDYMIPQQFIAVKDFQLNNNGKLDRAALPKPTEILSENPITRGVTSCFREAVGREPVAGISLMAQGIDSLGAISLLAALEQKFPVELDAAAWNIRLTPEEIVHMVETGLPRTENSHSARKLRTVPAFPMQSYLIRLEQANRIQHPFPLFNQMIYLLPLSDQVEFTRLNRAFLEIQQAHDAFRIRFSYSGGRLRMEKSDHAPATVQLVECPEADLIHQSAGELLTELDEGKMGWLLPQLEDLSWDSQALCRMIFCRGKGKNLLVLSVHHGIFDYQSLILFLEELERRYLGQLPVQADTAFLDCGLAFSHMVQGDEIRKQKAFWEQLIPQIQPFDWRKRTEYLPDAPEELGNSAPLCFAGEKESRQFCCKIPDGHYKQLKDFCSRQQLEEFPTLFALLRALQSQPQASLLFYTSGRSHLKAAGTIGYFSFPLPFACEERTTDFPEQVRLTDRHMKVLRSQEHGFWQVHGTENILGNSAIFDYQKLPKGSLWSNPMSFECIGVHNPFSFRIFDYGNRAEISIFYQVQKMPDTAVRRLAAAFLKQWQELII